jgi:hypothetical protein
MRKKKKATAAKRKKKAVRAKASPKRSRPKKRPAKKVARTAAPPLPESMPTEQTNMNYQKI